MASSPRKRFDGFEIDYAARTRRRKRAWRDRRLRRRIVLSSIAVFAALWLVVFVQLASGNDPALRRSLDRRRSRDAVALRAELASLTAWATSQARTSAQRLASAAELQRRLQALLAADTQLRRSDHGLRAQLAHAAAQLRQAAARAKASSNAGTSAAAASAAAASSSPAPAASAPVAPAPAPAPAAAPPPPAPAPAPVTTRSS